MDLNFDDEEKKLLEDFNSPEAIKSVPTEEEQEQLKEAARNFLAKETKMNIRINQSELDLIKKMADQEGLKYQTFIKSILHKYVTGQLIDKKKIG
ncbi:MAG: antitoxin [Spirochaetales bacterium]|nr:antitoxin [Spirochaetales bacterium]